MKEQELYLLITRYLSNQTSTEENEELADWIAADKRNEQTFEEVKRVWLGHKRPVDTESLRALAKLHAKISLDERKSGFLKIRLYDIYSLSAAALIILLVAGWFTYRQLSMPVQLEYQTVTTLSGQKKQFTLEDGTRVMLGPESTFSYPGSLKKGRRTVSIDGEAYFEVSKKPHQPFIVQTSSLTVQVLGTHFNINAGKNHTLSTVSLLEGKVKVKVREQVNEDYLLKPGEELSFNRVNHQIFQRSLDSASVLGWLNNILIFKNEELGLVVPRIEKMYGVRIILGDQATADTRLYAKFDNLPVSEVMKSICSSGMLTYRQDGNKIYINLKAEKKKDKHNH
ncbi:FecR family protein [Pararcticibacter amylolyticus]|uniref:Anti-sigma factor n=1 Tax=Pararcticibacter amylolyticus TaxID=2173175 RepID=A0A2U2PJG9_9SPHI|nr:FecR domain-containing protein [Pararcticibacter amylolyticus]PWG81545.1 hypothetical protein DDR33_06860 [Pararcticibacter amylolyticus]